MATTERPGYAAERKGRKRRFQPDITDEGRTRTRRFAPVDDVDMVDENSGEQQSQVDARKPASRSDDPLDGRYFTDHPAEALKRSWRELRAHWRS